MYPIFRMLYQLNKHRKAPALAIDGTHISHHICWPHDLDPWMELNNGRTLTLYDLGRLPFSKRIPLGNALKDRQWGMTLAGNTLRYRRRIRMFDRIEMRTRAIGRDARFVYLQQSMWVKGEAASSGIFRAAIVDKNGIVPTDEVVKQMGIPDWNPRMPDWVNAWIAAEAIRVWPPET
ncbi:MAG: thioesterase family protein [Rhodobacteraceae bacterium]|nr:thioesterase family protein [Paracoccaceae bacterium]